jgi:hypothetical protein
MTTEAVVCHLPNGERRASLALSDTTIKTFLGFLHASIDHYIVEYDMLVDGVTMRALVCPDIPIGACKSKDPAVSAITLYISHRKPVVPTSNISRMEAHLQQILELVRTPEDRSLSTLMSAEDLGKLITEWYHVFTNSVSRIALDHMPDHTDPPSFFADAIELLQQNDVVGALSLLNANEHIKKVVYLYLTYLTSSIQNT